MEGLFFLLDRRAEQSVAVRVEGLAQRGRTLCDDAFEVETVHHAPVVEQRASRSTRPSSLCARTRSPNSSLRLSASDTLKSPSRRLTTLPTSACSARISGAVTRRATTIASGKVSRSANKEPSHVACSQALSTVVNVAAIVAVTASSNVSLPSSEN